MRQATAFQVALICGLVSGSISFNALADEAPVNAPTKGGKPTDQTIRPSETKPAEEKPSPGGAVIMKPREPITQPRDPLSQEPKPIEQPREPRK